MTQKELKNLYTLNREISRDKERLVELEALSTSTSTHLTGMPHATSVKDRIGEYAAEIADLKALIELNIQKCWYELNKLNRYINTITDSQMRLIMSLRYINGMTWQQIAFHIGETDEQYPRKKHNKYLKDNL